MCATSGYAIESKLLILHFLFVLRDDKMHTYEISQL